MPDQPFPRRRFQFRLRTLFFAAAIVAVQCAVCLPMLREWQALQTWTDAGGTGSIAPFSVSITTVVPQTRLTRYNRKARRLFGLYDHAAQTRGFLAFLSSAHDRPGEVSTFTQEDRDSNARKKQRAWLRHHASAHHLHEDGVVERAPTRTSV